MRERILRELALLGEGGQRATLLADQEPMAVIYYNVPTTGGVQKPMYLATDTIVPVPAGYPASPIDLAGLPMGSSLLHLVKGGQNCQGVLRTEGRTWQLASYHPHGNGGGPPWDPMEHGFHTYFDHLLAWLRV